MAFVEQLLATASSTELLPYFLLPKYCSLKPGESDERGGGGIAVRIIEQGFWTGLWFVFLLAGGGGLFFIGNDDGQSKWFSHRNLPKNHRRDFLPYLKYDFYYCQPEMALISYFCFLT